MELLEALILGIVQGITEFLPISSSAHLVLVPWWLKWDNPPLIYVVAVHLGSTVAVLAYFWRDWAALGLAGWKALRSRSFDFANDPELRLLALLIIGTVPAAIAGVLLADFFEESFSQPAWVSFELLGTAVLLIYGERIARQTSISPFVSTASETVSGASSMTYFDAFYIGIAQAVAILPGISRSGSTIAAGLYRRLDHTLAVRFSFLLSAPIILGAGLKEAVDIAAGNVTVGADLRNALIIGFISSLIVAYASIAWLLRVVRRYGLYGFAAYCIGFGILSLVAVLVRG